MKQNGFFEESFRRNYLSGFETRYTLNENSFQDDSMLTGLEYPRRFSVTRINICRWHFNIAELFLTCNREKR